jgi:signal transduction histidine kinase
MWSCNSGLASRTLPQESVMLLMIQPLCYSVAFKSLQFEFVVATWAIIICALFGAVWMVEAYQSLPAILIYMPLSLALLLENHRQDLILFFVVKSQRKLLAENKQMSEERTTEMRHMIANVAHDLKTVSFFRLFFSLFFSSVLFSAAVRLHEWRGNGQERPGVHQRAAKRLLRQTQPQGHIRRPSALHHD